MERKAWKPGTDLAPFMKMFDKGKTGPAGLIQCILYDKGVSDCKSKDFTGSTASDCPYSMGLIKRITAKYCVNGENPDLELRLRACWQLGFNNAKALQDKQLEFAF